MNFLVLYLNKSLYDIKTYFYGVGVRMTERQNDTVRHFDTVLHFGTDIHFGTATK